MSNLYNFKLFFFVDIFVHILVSVTENLSLFNVHAIIRQIYELLYKEIPSTIVLRIDNYEFL